MIKNFSKFNEDVQEESQQELENNEYFANIDVETVENNNFRKEIYTGTQMQITLMSLEVGEEIGEEVHEKGDQFFRVESGKGTLVIDGEEKKFETDYGFTITAGKSHNVINTGDEILKVYSIYAPPEHERGTLHKTKEDDKHEH